MDKNHLQFAWRTLTRHPATTAINILGLALGLCACIAIYTITHYEFSFDDFHPDRQRIYRVGGKVSQNFGTQKFASEFFVEHIPPPAPGHIRADIPGIETVAPAYRYNDTAILTTNDYFDILQYDWLAGNKKTALTTPGSIVLTESQALKLFGRQTPDAVIGKPLTLDDSLHLQVTGILKDWTGNTDFPQTEFISFSTIAHTFLHNRFHPDNWAPGPNNPWPVTLVKIKPHSDPVKIQKQIAGIRGRYDKAATGGLSNIIRLDLILQPLADIHFNEAYSHDGLRKAHRPALYGLIGIAAFILLLAIVNFINLSTAHSLRRTKEIGVRKVLGGSKNQLTLRFLTETALITTLAALLGMALVQPVLHLFRSYLFEGIRFHPLSTQTLLFTITVITTTTLLAGFYPARVLASYNPATTLKNNPKDRHGSIRKGLIVFQFVISGIFIIGSITASRQIHYMLDADMGFATDAVVTVNAFSATPGELHQFAQKAAQLPDVTGWTLQSYAPAGSATVERPVRLDGQERTNMFVRLQGADENFLPFYHLKLLAGHNLSPSDSLNGFLINATYCRGLGFKNPADAIGHSLNIVDQPSWPIVGVIADYHENSLHDAIVPLLIGHWSTFENTIALHLANILQTLPRLGSTWESIVKNQPFSYTFLDESIAKLYQQDQRLGWLVQAATAIAIFISCIGLIGLAAFTAEQRKKEIAIRKVLGAGISNIILLLTKEFVLLLTIAFGIAIPIAAYGLHRWLENYAYRTTLSVSIFALAAITLLGITGLTVAARVIKAARQNPVENLRSPD
ncbi:MAG TPA: ABC transporter permease [Puia sp.]|uniref:ABC transporter permease n=1 Tax=Puia sp. TaxID=2045100 RepID=UPI002CD82EA0|nr:ABC transporter permease [Puia sp.]HVU95211.1 ABC transporter permease [Puia sp.]